MEKKCGCYNCIEARDERDETGWPVLLTRMVVCEFCGNKRCPHATDHKWPCTGSNEPGQFGSRYA